MLVERGDQLREIHQRARQAVDLVDDDHVDQAFLDVFHEAFQRGAIHIAAGIAAIIVMVGHERPAFMALRHNIGLGGVTLRVEGVVFHVQAFFGGLAGVNRAADTGLRRRVHAVFLFDFCVNPKKAGPDIHVPVMSQAICVRLL